MEVNDAMLDKLASLAKLRFNPEEAEALKADLQRMISFVQKMNEVDTADVEPLQHMAVHPNNWREDEVKGSVPREAALKNAANHNDDFFMVPKVIKK